MKHRRKHFDDDRNDVDDDRYRYTIEQRCRMIVKPNREYDIPYLAGISQAGDVVYIDRHMPDGFTRDGVWVPTDRFLIWHETEEYDLIKADRDRMQRRFQLAQRMNQEGEWAYSFEDYQQDLDLLYDVNHEEAERSEKDACELYGIPWEWWNEMTTPYIKQAEAEHLQRCPPDLFIIPYEDEEDMDTLMAIAKAGGPVSDLIRVQYESSRV